MRINDKGNDIVVKPLHSFSFKSVTPYRTTLKTATKKSNKCIHQQSLLLNDTDFTSDDEEHIYSRNPKTIQLLLQIKFYPKKLPYYKKKRNPLGHQNQHLQHLQTNPQPLHTIHTLYFFMIHPSSNTKLISKASFFQTNIR